MTSGIEIDAARFALRHLFAGDMAEPLSTALSRSDPDRLARYAQRHRVEGLVWQGIAALGALASAPFALLARSAEEIRDHSRRATDTIYRFERQLDRAGIDHVHLKGVTLASLAWPDPMAKHGWDIDVLIESDCITDAAAILESEGFARTLPAPPIDLRAWHRRRKESVWIRSSDDIVIELHGRPLPWQGLGPDLRSPRQKVRLRDGLIVETFAEQPLRHYLALHGASSLWFRLKWIADYAALAHRHPSSPVPGRAGRLADSLAHRMFGIGRPGDCDFIDRGLLAAASEQLVGKAAWREPTETPFGTLPFHLAQWVIGGPGDVWRQWEEYRG